MGTNYYLKKKVNYREITEGSDAYDQTNASQQFLKIEFKN